MVNLSDLKIEQIRKTINVSINGEVEEVVIFNLLDEDRVELKDKIANLNDKGLEGAELVDELYTEVFIQCTNIVVDENIIDVLNNPSGDMLKVLHEVFDIIYELQTEVVMDKYQLICSFKSMEYARLMLLQAQEVKLISDKCEEVEKNIKELKKVGKPKKKK